MTPVRIFDVKLLSSHTSQRIKQMFTQMYAPIQAFTFAHSKNIDCFAKELSYAKQNGLNPRFVTETLVDRMSNAGAETEKVEKTIKKETSTMENVPKSRKGTFSQKDIEDINNFEREEADRRNKTTNKMHSSGWRAIDNQFEKRSLNTRHHLNPKFDVNETTLKLINVSKMRGNQVYWYFWVLSHKIQANACITLFADKLNQPSLSQIGEQNGSRGIQKEQDLSNNPSSNSRGVANTTGKNPTDIALGKNTEKVKERLSTQKEDSTQ